MNIFESLENLNISEECFNDILNIVEEYINEVYSVTDVKQRAAKVKESRLGALKKSKNLQNPNTQRNLARARRVMSILELPDSNRPFKKVQKAADNSLQGRKTAKEGYDKRYSENSIASIKSNPNIKRKDVNLVKDFVGCDDKSVEKASKKYLKSVGLSSKKGKTHPFNNTPYSVDPSSGLTADSDSAKGRREEPKLPDYEYQNRYYH